ncbi:hypothetical protein H2248_011933 [Termitomyces sp. 'cryptogamus']|nr:hypothetical protein H2248_011933 [Termitomyces sp. 'cryptogamus']
MSEPIVLYAPGLISHMKNGCTIGLQFFRWQGCAGLIACMIAEVILQTRIYAMYSLNKKVLVLMGVSFIFTTSTSATIMGIVLSRIKASALPFRGLIFCVPENVDTHFYAFWIPMLAFESLLCFLAVYKGYETFRSTSPSILPGHHLVQIIIRDSVLYFVVYGLSGSCLDFSHQNSFLNSLFATYLTNFLIFLIAPNLLEIPIGFSVTMSCVMGNRISLNVRNVNRELDLAGDSVKLSGHLSSPVSTGRPWSIVNPLGQTSLNDIEMAELRLMKAEIHTRI